MIYNYKVLNIYDTGEVENTLNIVVIDFLEPLILFLCDELFSIRCKKTLSHLIES